MILSHSKRFIFIAVPKTASQSMRQMLRTCIDSQDEEQCVYQGKRYFKNDQIKKIGHGHISFSQIEGVLDEKLIQEYKSIAVVRNPYDRFISAAFYFFGDHPMMQKAPTLHLKNLLLFPNHPKRLWFQPQVYFLKNKRGKVEIDYLLRLENLEEDVSHIRDFLGASEVPFPRLNTSEREPYRSYLDEELIQLLNKAYAEDFALLNYELEYV